MQSTISRMSCKEYASSKIAKRLSLSHLLSKKFERRVKACPDEPTAAYRVSSRQ